MRLVLFKHSPKSLHRTVLSHCCTRHTFRYYHAFVFILALVSFSFNSYKSRWVTITCNSLACPQEIRHFAQLVYLLWSWLTVTKLIIPRPMRRGRRGMHQPLIISLSQWSERIRDREILIPFLYLLLHLENLDFLINDIPQN